MHESGEIFLRGHFGGSLLELFLGHIWGSFWGVRYYVAKVLSKSLIVFAQNRCVAGWLNFGVGGLLEGYYFEWEGGWRDKI